MVESVNKILGMSIEDIISSDACLILLRTYSKLYMNGAQCRTCSNSQRQYYIKLKKSGLEMAKKYDAAKNRTCIPKWNGLKYIAKTAKHWNSNLISDADAIMLLNNGFVLESQFIKLPDGYSNTPIISSALLTYSGNEYESLELVYCDGKSDILFGESIQSNIDSLPNNIELICKGYVPETDHRIDSLISNLNTDILNIRDYIKVPDEVITSNQNIGINQDYVPNDVLNIDGDLNENELACISEIKGLLDSGLTVKQIRSKYSNVTEIGDVKCTQRELSKLIKLAKK